MKDENVKELNSLLKGEYMAIDKYDHYINNIKETNIREKLEHIQHQHKNQAIEVSKKIQKLGGNPINSAGIQGVISEAVSGVIRIKDPEKIIEQAIDGEEIGISKTNEILLNIGDAECKNTVKSILKENENIVNTLNDLIDDLNSK